MQQSTSAYKCLYKVLGNPKKKDIFSLTVLEIPIHNSSLFSKYANNTSYIFIIRFIYSLMVQPRNTRRVTNPKCLKSNNLKETIEFLT